LLDWFLWDVWKEEAGVFLLSEVMVLTYGGTKVSVAGKICGSADVRTLLEKGVDAVSIGRGGILHHDFPEQCHRDDFVRCEVPVTESHLKKEGLSTAFIDYMRNWNGFVEGSFE
jgi:2,4-dienoyl-CoA reductase-like NADH-dependent reductase (Old Yellow Enzyme family)